MEIVFIAVGLAILALLSAIAVTLMTNQGRRRNETTTEKLDRIASELNQINASMASDGRVSDQQHQETRQVLTLLGTQVQQLSSAIHQAKLSKPSGVVQHFQTNTGDSQGSQGNNNSTGRNGG